MILEITKIYIGSTITKLPQNMKLPHYHCQSTVTEIQAAMTEKLGLHTSGRIEFNGIGSELPCAAPASKFISTTINLLMADGQQISSPGGCGWFEIEEGVVGNKT